MNLGWFTSNAQPGPDHTEQRKIIKKAIGLQVVSDYDHIIYKEAGRLLERLSNFGGDPHPLLAQ
jgi:hypothetical protein